MTDLAKLVVKLEAQTAQYMSALDAAEKRLKRFDKQAVSLSGIGSAAATVATAAAAAIGILSKQAIDGADRLNELSQASGLSTEALSQLEFAAGQSGLDLEALSKSTAILQRQQVAAAKGSKEVAKAFDSIGVSTRKADGSLKGTEELLLDIADSFSRLEDGAGKTAVAQTLFGRSAQQMIPFLNEGRDGITKLREQADALGLTITEKTAKAADQFNDNLGALKGAARGLVSQLIEESLPTMVAISESFIDSAKAGGAMEFAVKSLSVAFKTFVTAGIVVKSIFQQLGRVIYGAAAAIVRVANGEFSLAAQELRDAFDDASANVTDDIETIAKVWGDAAPQMERAGEAAEKGLKKSLIFNSDKASEEAAKARDAALESLAGLEQGLAQQVATFGMTEAAVMQYRVTLGDLAVTLDKAGEAGKVYGDTIVALQEQLDTLNEKKKADEDTQQAWNKAVEEGARITESVRKPAEVYSDTIERLNDLLEKGIITQETYNRAVSQAQDAFDKARRAENKFLEEANRNIQDIIADGLGTALHDGIDKGAKGALEAFGDMLEKMALQAIAADIAKKIFGEDGLGGGGGWLDKMFNGGGKSGFASGEWDWMDKLFSSKGNGSWIDTAAGFISGIFGGTRDSGGRGRPGVAYAIGIDEEYYVPDRPGMFVTGEQMRRGANITQNIHVQGQVTQRSARQLELEAARRQRTATTRLA